MHKSEFQHPGVTAKTGRDAMSKAMTKLGLNGPRWSVEIFVDGKVIVWSRHRERHPQMDALAGLVRQNLVGGEPSGT